MNIYTYRYSVISAAKWQKRYQQLSLIIIGVLFFIPNQAAMALCASKPEDGSFERQKSPTVGKPWIAEGVAGIDIGRKLSYREANNAWARNTTGWNAIRQQIVLTAGDNYTISAFIRTSPNVRDGYFGFRDANQRPVSEIKFGPLPVYTELKVNFKADRSGKYNIFAGFWAPNADAWIQVDDVRVAFPCRDTE